MRFSRRQALLLPVAISLGAALSGAPALASEPPLIVVQPLGTAPESSDVDAVVSAVRTFFRVRIAVLDPMPLPKAAFYPPRRRYRAERILDALVERAPGDARVVLGLTTVDISTTKGAHKDWGVLGLATLDGSSAVLSSFRCKRGARNIGHVRRRFAKTAVHELGHSFGLDHCPTPGCLMHDGEGNVRTTDGETDFCPDTRKRLGAAGVLVEGSISPFIRDA